MTAVDWLTPRNALDAALPASGPLRTVGNRIIARLDATGAIYDVIYSVEIDAAKGIGDASYASSVAANDTAIQTAYLQLDTAAREVETLQQAVQGSEPGELIGTAAGVRYVMSPGTATPWDPDALGDVAGLTLLDGSSEVLRLVSKDLGVWGNTIQARVVVTAGSTVVLAEDGVSPIAGVHDFPIGTAGTIIRISMLAGPSIDFVYRITPDVVFLEVRRASGSDAYVERYAIPSAGAKIDVKTSLLLASAEWFVGATMPDAISFTSFADGEGGSKAQIRTRASRASALPEGVAYASTIALLLAELDALEKVTVSYPNTSETDPYTGLGAATEFIHQGTVYLVAGTVEGIPADQNPQRLSVKQVEDRLVSMIAEATALQALI